MRHWREATRIEDFAATSVSPDTRVRLWRMGNATGRVAMTPDQQAARVLVKKMRPRSQRRSSSELALVGVLSGESSLSLDKHGIAVLPEQLIESIKGTVEDLVLSGNRITKVPDVIADLSQLRKLDLEGNGICELPECITHLCKLEALFLGRNQLAKLPKGMRSLTAMKELDLRWNRFTKLPTCVYDLSSLEILAAACNRIASLDGRVAVGELTNLQSLCGSTGTY